MATLNSVKENIHMLLENQWMQWEQIREQCELLNIPRIETTENRKLPRRLEQDSLQLNTSFSVIFREAHADVWKKAFS